MYKKKIMVICILGASSLISGGMLYLFFRENVYISNFTEKYIPLLYIRQALMPVSSNFLKFYLPDFLWGFSLACWLCVVLSPFKKSYVLGSVIAFCAGLLFEILQYLKIIGGTFDIADIILYLLAVLAVYFINFKTRRE